jgi:Cof subfamily protein (haloacid dehalogenase superfamily)
MKAVVTDLDGTLVRSDGAISAVTLAAARELRASGIALFLATARTPSWIRSRPALAAVSTAAVCCGGSLVWEPIPGTIPWRRTIARDSIEKILAEVTSRFPTTGFGSYDGEQWTVTAAYAASGVRRPGRIVLVAPEHLGTDASALSIFCPERSALEEVCQIVDAAHPGAARTVSAAGLIDIGPAHVDKSDGIRWLLERHGIAAEHAVAFGDDLPDLPLFGVCGVAVAMENSHPDVKRAAARVAPAVEADGVVRVLVEMGLVPANCLDRALAEDATPET